MGRPGLGRDLQPTARTAARTNRGRQLHRTVIGFSTFLIRGPRSEIRAVVHRFSWSVMQKAPAQERVQKEVATVSAEMLLNIVL